MPASHGPIQHIPACFARTGVAHILCGDGCAEIGNRHIELRDRSVADPGGCRRHAPP